MFDVTNTVSRCQSQGLPYDQMRVWQTPIFASPLSPFAFTFELLIDSTKIFVFERFEILTHFKIKSPRFFVTRVVRS